MSSAPAAPPAPTAPAIRPSFHYPDQMLACLAGIGLPRPATPAPPTRRGFFLEKTFL